MYEFKRLSQVFKSAEQIPFDDFSRIILMSDCHRGDGSWADDFSKNQNIYFAALTHYYNENYTYIELGDGDELWENTKLSDIMREHSNAFWLINKFIRENRFYSLYGNHDIVKRNKGFSKSKDYRNFDEREKEYLSSFGDVKFHEGLVLRHTDNGSKIFLVHGHQVDYLNDRLWRLSRFLVRYVWRTLELLGVNDPTSAAKNYNKKDAVEKKLAAWATRESQMLIAGHTHRPMFPEVGEALYFNGGSCVHPRCITGIEIADGNITLVKWSVKTKDDGTLVVGRDVLAGPRKLKDYFCTGALATGKLGRT
ncbi:MAG: metallophosphoesterase family protein [Clostridia bacterium]|nr:metallophosphoesterase family protein [Clostridia bacterium]